MIPLLPLVMLAGKFIQSLSGKSNAGAAVHQPAPTDNRFEQMVRCLSHQTGIPLKEMINPTLAVLEPRLHGVPLITSLAHHGNAITITMCSSIDFPSGAVHPDVKRRLPGLTYPEDGFRLTTLDGSKGSFVTAEATVSIRSLSPPAFAQLIDSMMGRLGLVDALILEQGYHR